MVLSMCQEMSGWDERDHAVHGAGIRKGGWASRACAVLKKGRTNRVEHNELGPSHSLSDQAEAPKSWEPQRFSTATVIDLGGN